MCCGSLTTLCTHTDCINYTGAVSGPDEIILSPPSSLTVTEGDTVLIPCVGSVDPMFSGLPMATGGVVSPFGLTFTADRRDNGSVLSCEVGANKQDVTIEVLGKYSDDIMIIMDKVAMMHQLLAVGVNSAAD